MELNNLKPAKGSVKSNNKRVGRGEGSGKGGTATRGHKGAKSRSGYSKKIGFEGGQMPIQKRLPKYGFTSRVSRISAEVRLAELNSVQADVIDIAALKAAGLIGSHIQRAKVFLSGEIKKAVTLKGIPASKGAREAIEAAGGKIEE